MGDESMEDVFLQDDLSPTTAEHAMQCQSLFHKYMAMPNIVPDPTIMDDQLARFSLWASDTNVYGPPDASLDYGLRFNPAATDVIHGFLGVIRLTLLSFDDLPSRLSNKRRRRISEQRPVTGTTSGGGSSDPECEFGPAENNILKIIELIGGALTHLSRLSNALQKSAKSNPAHRIESYTDDEEAKKAEEELRLYTKSYLGLRFPKAPEALCLALVEANVLRLRRLYRHQSHLRHIDPSFQGPHKAPAIVDLPNMMESVSLAVQFASDAPPKPEAISKLSALSPGPGTNAATGRKATAADLYADSVHEIRRAESVLVNHTLPFPPIPATQKCPYCGVIIEFEDAARSLQWQNHVMEDLEPFICFFPRCLESGHQAHEAGPVTFETLEAWCSHMQTAHGQIWECRAPSHELIIFHQETEYQEHCIKEHDVPKARVGTFSNAARRSALDKVLGCPFGDGLRCPGKDECSTVFSSKALQSHVADHMKDMALLTLHSLPSDDG